MLSLSRRDLRLASGLVLFVYVTLHLVCHALGLVSLEMAETALRATVVIWHSPPGTLLLYGAAFVHVGLALFAVYERRTLRMPPLQALRIALGLLMPLALIGHYVGTRYAHDRFGLPAEYARVAANIWAAGGQGLALGLLAPGWLHGCLGLRFAFGSRRGWQRASLPLFGAALLLPVLAALGFVTMGRELTAADRATATIARPTEAQGRVLGDMRENALDAYFAAIALVAGLRLVRRLDERRRKAVIRIAYPERRVVVPRGWTVLEASRSHGIPHQSTCGGRARCTTCRVRVLDGAAHCPPPQQDEARTLARIDAPPSERLACQLRPTGDITVEPVLAVATSRWRSTPLHRPTTEREVALLFFAVRLDAIATAARVSAHDTIYALDRFDALVGEAIEASHGVTCQRSGDRALALYGLGGDLAEAARRAHATAARVAERATSLAARLEHDLRVDAAFAVGVHVGSVVVGTLGPRSARRLSAIGPAVEAAERLQQEAVTHHARWVVSRPAARAASLDEGSFEWRAVASGHKDDDALLAWASMPPDGSARAQRGVEPRPAAGESVA
ncbi:MAG: 2Fe-2S iron-sulfur cluster-binding protein [Caldimonas sp.]